MEFIELMPEDDLYSMIASRLRELVGNAIIGIATYDQAANTITLRSVLGLGKKSRPFLKILGKNPKGMEITPTAETRKDLIKGHLHLIPGGLPALSIRQLSKTILQAVARLFHIGDIYHMGFTQKGQLLGSVGIALLKDNKLKNPEVVETYIRLASTAIRRTLAEEALWDSMKTSTDIVRYIPAGLFIYQYEAPDKLILLDGNAEAETLTGIKISHWRNREFNEIWPSARERGITDAFLDAVDTGKTFETEDLNYKDQHLDGAFRLRAFRIPGQRLAVAFDNITERKKTELEKEKLQSQLLQAQKMEAIGTLTGGVAHDFNNLLTVILGYSELIKKKMEPGNPLYDNLRQISNAAEMAVRLTRQLLLFSRKQPMEIAILDINEMVNDLLKLIKRVIGEDISICTILEPTLYKIRGDAGFIEQVIMNLVINAKDAMPQGGELRIKTENLILDEAYCRHVAEAKPGKCICLSMADTGIGMDSYILQHIFDPFFTTKQRGKGTGLGLSVVYGIVKQQEGFIQVESEPGQGATFKIYFPALAGEFKGKTPGAASPQKFRGQGQRILLVEDEAELREFTYKILQDNGYRVQVSDSAERALAAFEKKNQNFQLAFIDIVLPEKNGLVLAEELLGIKPDLKVILTSGYTDDKVQWQTIRQKGFPFIQKPFSIEDLLRVIRKALAPCDKSEKK